MKKLEIPINLDLDQLIEKNNVNHIRGFHKDKIHFICNSIYHGMSKLDDKFIHPSKKEKFFVPLKAEILKSMLGDCYKKILEWMVNSEIIYRDKHYSKGNFSIGCRFVDKYLSVKSKTVTVTNSFLYKKHFKYDSNVNKDKRITDKLETFLKSEKLKVDFDLVERVYEQLMASVTSAEDAIRINIAYSSTKANLQLLQDGDFHVKQDNTGYRVHSPLTNLKKEYRKCLSYDGMSLVEIDFCNSQFFLMNYLLQLKHWTFNSTLSSNPKKVELLKRLRNNTNIYSPTKDDNITIMILKFLENRFRKGFQECQFSRDSVNGTIYNVIQENVVKNDTIEIDKNETKQHLIALSFASKQHHYHYFNGKYKPIWDCFKAVYSEATTLIDIIKSKDYKDFAKVVQRIESYLVINQICGSWTKMHPKKFIATIHDCIITTIDNKDELEAHILTQSEALIGLRPQLSSKVWISQNMNTVNKLAA